MYERIICVMPLIGAGTPDDPRRPMFMPADPEKAAAERKDAQKAEGKENEPDRGIIAFSMQESDDGKLAIVELVARDRRAFQPILESKDGRVKTFRRDRGSKDEMLSELQKVKRDFKLENFGLAVQ